MTTGACCVETERYDVVDEVACLALEGSFLGIETGCTDVDVDCATGACCVPQGCFVLSWTECITAVGVFFGGSDCNEAPECFRGVCCRPNGQCVELADTTSLDALAGLCEIINGHRFHPTTLCAYIVDCPTPPLCPGDADGSGVVDIDDIVEVVLHFDDSCLP